MKIFSTAPEGNEMAELANGDELFNELEQYGH